MRNRMNESNSYPETILQLIERYEFHRVKYTKITYSEAQLREEYVDPFFRALGWDVYNRQGLSEPYQEVVREQESRIRGKLQYMDYAFRIGGVQKFVVLVTKPFISLSHNDASAVQLRRYARATGLPLSILTNFDELAIYTCQKPPKRFDGASLERLKYYTYRDYENKWGEIASIFSKDSVLRGSLDAYSSVQKKNPIKTRVSKVSYRKRA
jgi:hypothetical protein